VDPNAHLLNLGNVCTAELGLHPHTTELEIKTRMAIPM